MFQNITDGLPDRVKGPFPELNAYMQRLLTDLLQLDLSTIAASELFDNFLESFLNMTLREAKERKSVRKQIHDHGWDKIVEAQRLIDENPDKHFHISRISSMIGMNEYRLKKLFPIATGFNIDEYRKYWLCVAAAKKIIQRPDLPLKNFYSQAGYSGESTFVRGFKKSCCCTPGELRGDEWDVNNLVFRLPY